MPTFQVTAPDGSTYEIDGPDGATEQDAIAEVQRQLSAQPKIIQDRALHTHRLAQAQAALDAQRYSDPSAGPGTLSIGPFNTGIQTPEWLNRGLAGFGKAMVDVGAGAEQLRQTVADPASAFLPQQPSVLNQEYQAEAERRRLDAPLMATAAGQIGYVGGGIASTLPVMAIPGANTVAGSALIGGGYAALQPTTSTVERGVNTAVGAGTGALSQYLSGKAANFAQNRMAARAQAATDEASLQSARDAVLKQSKQAGYVVPPTAVNENVATASLESLAGKQALRQRADAINQRVTDKLIRADLGMAANKPITSDALESIRGTAGKVYEQVKNTGVISSDAQFQAERIAITSVGADLEAAAPGIGAQAGEKVKQLAEALDRPNFKASDAVGLFKFLNNRAKDGFKTAFASGNPEALDLARAQSAAADAVGGLIDRHLASIGQQDLATAWQQARQTIAKTYMAEAALRGGHINALGIAAQVRKGAYASGGFKAVADFAEHFGEFSRLPKPGVGVSKLGATLATGGAGWALTTGHPGLAAGMIAAPAASYGLGNALLSRGAQSLLTTPSYTPGLLGTGTLNALQYLGQGGRALAIPGSNALVQALR